MDGKTNEPEATIYSGNKGKKRDEWKRLKQKEALPFFAFLFAESLKPFLHSFFLRVCHCRSSSFRIEGKSKKSEKGKALEETINAKGKQKEREDFGKERCMERCGASKLNFVSPRL
jgi:hypothetical protein